MVALAATILPALAVATLAGCASPMAPESAPVVHAAPAPASIPWCKVLDGSTVVGQAGGKITVEGIPAGTLVLVDDDVADESGPYSGYLANVDGITGGDTTVAVQGIACAQ